MAKNTKKKGFKRFFLGLAIYAVVFLALAFWGLTEFWSFIDAYELSRPKNAIAPYVQQLTKEQVASADSQLLSQIDHNIQSEDACKQFILSSLDQDITYAQNVAESSDTQMIYMLLHDGKAIGKVTLTPEAADKYGFTPWKVTGQSFDFSHLLGSEASITVPHDFAVYANGVKLDSSYITQDGIPYEALKRYYSAYQPPYMVTYTVSQEKNITNLLTPFLKSYVAFTSNDGGKENTLNNYDDLLQYLVSGGDMAARMKQALDGLGWAKDSGSAITNIQINHMVDLGDGHYLCDVTYTVEAELYRDDPITVNNAKIIMVETRGKLRVESLMVY